MYGVFWKMQANLQYKISEWRTDLIDLSLEITGTTEYFDKIQNNRYTEN